MGRTSSSVHEESLAERRTRTSVVRLNPSRVKSKWIKQNLRIKAYFGTSENAVKTQVWIAISTDVLVAILKRELKINRSLSDILQILSLTRFEKTPVFQALPVEKTTNPESSVPQQKTMFDLSPDSCDV